MTWHRYYHAFGLCVLAGLATGCGSGNSLNRQALSGEVVFAGSPLDKGTIQFEPSGPNGLSTGAMIQDGKFKLPSEQGLPPGKYLVRIFSPDAANLPQDALPGDSGDNPPVAKERIPEKFNVKSDQFVDVKPSGGNVFKFDIPAK